MTRLTLALILALVALPAAAQDTPPRPELHFHGYAKAMGELELADPYRFGGAARLQADLTGGFKVVDFRAMVDLDLDATPSSADLYDRTASVRLIPVELRVNTHLGPVDLSAGKQYVFWGQTDWVNPTDLFTPWDYMNISSELEDYRVAPWALRGTAYMRATSFDLVWVPWPTPHVMDMSLMAGDDVIIADPSMPRRVAKNSDLGLRFNTRFGGFDLSLMGFHGLDKRPGMQMDVEIDTSVMPPPPGGPEMTFTLTPTYGMMNAFGGDLSWGAGPVLLKTEWAYYLTYDEDGTDPLVRNPELYGVFGVTLVPVSWLNFTVQGTMSHLSKYDPEDEEAALIELGMPDPEVDPINSYSMVERASVDIRDTVSIQVVAMQNIPSSDHFEMAFVSWRAADALTLLGGVVIFGGPENTEFGRIKEFSRAFVEVKYSF